MDATNVLTQLTNTWSKCLDQYYDHVAENHMKAISEKYNIPIEDLMIKSKDLKEDIMKKLTNCIPTKAETKPVKNSEKKINENTNIESLGRKELQTMCKDRGIPTKRKNADMVLAIQDFDLKNKVEEIKNKVEEKEEYVEKEKEEYVEKEKEEYEAEAEAEEDEAEAEEDELYNFKNINLNGADELQEDEYVDEY